MTNKTPWQHEHEATERLREALDAQGVLLGETGGLFCRCTYRLLGGAVYCTLSHIQHHYAGTLEEFQKHPPLGFRPA
jgi:hypothetical protein